MITVVKSGKEAFNNSKLLANITLFRRLKVWYYKVFAWIYGVVGQFSHLVLVNSSWTLNHIVALWNVPDRTHILYPPADTKYLQKFAVDRRAPPRCQPSSSSSSSTNLVISLGQFRPEKNQELQLRAFARFLRNHRQQQQQEKRPLEEKKGKRIDDKNIKLVLIGGCRNEDDQKRVKNLKHLASTLGILGVVLVVMMIVAMVVMMIVMMIVIFRSSKNILHRCTSVCVVCTYVKDNNFVRLYVIVGLIFIPSLFRSRSF